MEIRRCFCFIFINCVLIQYREAKTVSLNELIAAESQGEPVEEKPSPRSVDPGTNRNSLNEVIAEESRIKRVKKIPTPRKLKGLFNRLSLRRRLTPNTKLRKLKSDISKNIEKITPLKYRKAFQIKSPLRPKKLKLSQKLRYKRKNQSRKRETSSNEPLKQKYIPLLKSLSMLFDNLINSDASDSYEIKPKKYKRYRFYSDEHLESFEDYSSESSSRVTKSRTYKKTTSTTPSTSIKVSSDTENITHSEDNDYSTIRPNKSVPVLLSRNTFSFRRNDNGSSERSGTTFDGNVKRNIARNYGDNEHNTGRREHKTYEEGDENDTNSSTRNDPSGIRHTRTDGNGYYARNSKERKTVDSIYTKNENTNDSFREIQFKTRGNKTESENFVPEPVRRLRGHIPEDQIASYEGSISETTESLQSKDIREESFYSTSNDSTGHKRIFDKDGPLTTEDEKIRRRNETVILIERNSRSGNNSNHTGKKAPVVLIFDGYSVTRDKNGENKVSGKKIHIHS